MSETYYFTNKVLDKTLGDVDYYPPGTWYVGLSTTTVLADGTGATEPSGNGYARVALTNSKSSFEGASNGSLKNLVSITFPESTASWGTITYVTIYDAETSGNIWLYQALTTPKAVPELTTVYFSVGSLTFTRS